MCLTINVWQITYLPYANFNRYKTYLDNHRIFNLLSYGTPRKQRSSWNVINFYMFLIFIYNENYWGAAEVDKNSRGSGNFCTEMTKYWFLWYDKILIHMKLTKADACPRQKRNAELVFFWYRYTLKFYCVEVTKCHNNQSTQRRIKPMCDIEVYFQFPIRNPSYQRRIKSICDTLGWSLSFITYQRYGVMS